MKVKHWQGYGSVDMKVISRKQVANIKTIVVRVSGNHEWGLVRDDEYDIYHWICSRFAKDCKSYVDIIDTHIQSDYTKDVETCDYTIIYRIGGQQ